ncbi:MAG: YihY/virulence factor BrkB family protein [Lachnospiraceae bacterium]
MIYKLIRIVQDFARKIGQDNISAFSASTAFFFFLSLIPMLMIICGILPFTPLTEANLMELITSITPDTVDPLMITIIHQVYRSSTGLLSLAIFITLWSAGKGMLALMQGLNAVNEVIENRNYFVLRIIASFYTLIILVMMVLSLCLSVFGKYVIQGIVHYAPRLEGIANIILNFRFLFTWLFVSIILVLMYTYIPNKKLKLIFQVPGAMISSIAWNIFSWGFSIYIDTFNAFGAYGYLGTIMIIMLWLYFVIYIILIGANFNRYFMPVIRVFYKRIR